MTNDFANFKNLELLFSIPDHSETWHLYHILRSSMLIPDDKHFTILYLCSCEQSAIQNFKYIKYNLNENVEISHQKSYIKECNLKEHKIIFYNSAKNRLEEIYVFSIRKLKQGFDGYRISEVRFLD